MFVITDKTKSKFKVCIFIIFFSFTTWKKTHELYSFNEKVKNISKTYVFRQIGLQSYPKMYFAEP